jgi:hypothetical protein
VNEELTDKELITFTFLNATMIKCPLCEHVEEIPAVPVSDALGSIFGMSGDTLARVHGEQNLKRGISNLRRHMGKHTPDDWIRLIIMVKESV